MRSALIHFCRSVEHETVWLTVHENLPELRAQVAALLDEPGNAS
jgi:uncharacterized protein with HEPN domain